MLQNKYMENYDWKIHKSCNVRLKGVHHHLIKLSITLIDSH